MPRGLQKHAGLILMLTIATFLNGFHFQFRRKTYQPEKEWDEKKWAESYYDHDEKKCDSKADKHYDADQGLLS